MNVLALSDNASVECRQRADKVIGAGESISVREHLE